MNTKPKTYLKNLKNDTKSTISNQTTDKTADKDDGNQDSMTNQTENKMSRLEIVDSKTGGSYMRSGSICRSWSSGRARILGAKTGESSYHVMSRTTGGDRLFDAEDKEALRKIMIKMSAFTGLKILTWCILDNHFHVLLRVPNQEKYLSRFDDKRDENGALSEPEGSGNERLLTHLSTLYSKAYITKLRDELDVMRELGHEDEVEKFLNKYRRRFCDLSIYVKEVKERFSRYFNRKYDRIGTLWMSRFRSVLVEDGEALRTMSAYIDLNPVRAGIVDDPKDYRWCGYGEAMGGSTQAKQGLCLVMDKPLDSWAKHGSWYRCWLMIDGKEVPENKPTQANHVKTKKGIPEEIAQAALDASGQLSISQLLMTRVKYLSTGAAIGSQSFIESLYVTNREKFGPTRKVGAKQTIPLPQITPNTPSPSESKKSKSPHKTDRHFSSVVDVSKNEAKGKDAYKNTKSFLDHEDNPNPGLFQNCYTLHGCSMKNKVRS